ncbi:hypothetical protein OKW43_000039 [Paraburkholderia sp. WC7.3g]|uniref:hypothetical protein n=1 Tax=Paraburkholderia sp. WC7.3g TaxID=2991070 RepID=UPI003D23E809
MADQLDFVIDQGADWPVQLVLKNDDGSLMKLAGCQARLTCRAFPASPIVLIDLSTVAGTMTLNGLDAQINWTVPGAQTALYTPQSGAFVPNALMPQGTVPFGVYDLFIKTAGGQLIKYLCGKILLSLGETSPF